MKLNEEIFASKVVIGLVNSPLYDKTILETNEIDEYFKNYFNIPRRHKINDRLFVKNNLNQSTESFFLLKIIADKIRIRL